MRFRGINFSSFSGMRFRCLHGVKKKKAFFRSVSEPHLLVGLAICMLSGIWHALVLCARTQNCCVRALKLIFFKKSKGVAGSEPHVN